MPSSRSTRAEPERDVRLDYARSRRLGTAFLWSALGVLVLLILSGSGQPHVALRGPGDDAAARAVRVLIGDLPQGDPQAMLGLVPADYDEVMGYRPVIESINGEASLARADGQCSGPGTLPFDMEPTCRGHDLGYDLMRYAAAVAAPLGAWARPRIDQWWYDEMHLRCRIGHSGAAEIACHTQIYAIEAMVSTNTWREGEGPPLYDDPWRNLAAVVLTPAFLWTIRRWLHSAEQLPPAAG